jgi:hypothetical protein
MALSLAQLAAPVLGMAVASTFLMLALVLLVLQPLRLVGDWYSRAVVHLTDVFCAWTFPFFQRYSKCERASVRGASLASHASPAGCAASCTAPMRSSSPLRPRAARTFSSSTTRAGAMCRCSGLSSFCATASAGPCGLRGAVCSDSRFRGRAFSAAMHSSRARSGCGSSSAVVAGPLTCGEQWPEDEPVIQRAVDRLLDAPHMTTFALFPEGALRVRRTGRASPPIRSSCLCRPRRPWKNHCKTALRAM